MSRRREAPPLAPGDIFLFDDASEEEQSVDVGDDTTDVSPADTTATAASNASSSAKMPIPETIEEMRRNAVEMALEQFGGVLPDKNKMVATVLKNERNLVELHNATEPLNEAKWHLRHTLDYPAVVRLAQEYHSILLIDLTDGDNTATQADYPLAVYDPNEGVYKEITKDEISKVIGHLRESSEKTFRNNVYEELRNRVEVKTANSDPKLVPFRNGVYDMDSKTLIPYSSDMVFLTKSSVDYVENAPRYQKVMRNGETFDFDEWLDELANHDEEIVALFWEIIGAVLRPSVRWNMMFILFSEAGCSGKGTFLKLLQNIAGGKAAEITLDRMSEPFGLTGLIGASLVYGDENRVGGFLDDVSKAKAITTGDSVTVDRKHISPISIKARCVIVECFNSIPRVRDHSDSWWRRVCPIDFVHSFNTEGTENTEIKNEIMGDPKLLEYVCSKAVKNNFTKITIPAACRDLLDEMKTENNPVYEFYDEVVPQITWPRLPRELAYDLYKNWHRETKPSGTVLSRNKFVREFGKLVEAHGGEMPKQTIRFFASDDTISPKTEPKGDPIMARYGLNQMDRYEVLFWDGKLTSLKNAHKTPQPYPEVGRGFILPPREQKDPYVATVEEAEEILRGGDDPETKHQEQPA